LEPLHSKSLIVMTLARLYFLQLKKNIKV